MATVSPSSSPRLPSPPPMAEDQIGPTSPSVALFEDDDEDHGKLSGGVNFDSGVARRIRPGTRAEEMAEGPPLVELTELDSAFQLTEHLKALYNSHIHPVESSTTVPINLEIAKQLSRPPPNTSKEIWLYELARFLIQKTNAILVSLFADQPPCSPQTCPEMRASEWQYLCAVHDPPKSCSAIDYCCHTLDWAASLLTSSKMFPSRLNLGSGNPASGVDKMLHQQMKEITNIFRRVYRIYAHAWFQHREMFWRVEGKTGLYIFFKTVCDEFGLIQPENYTIPREAEGLEPESRPMEVGRTQPRPQSVVSVLKREPETAESETALEPAPNSGLSRADTTKRHRHTRSDLSSSVSTVIQEEAEEEEEGEAKSPALNRQSTVLKEVTPESPSETIKDAEEEEPVPGIARSDTIKPTKDADEPEQEDQTVIVSETEIEAEEPSKEQPLAASKAEEPLAADSGESGDSVAENKANVSAVASHV